MSKTDGSFWMRSGWMAMAEIPLREQLHILDVYFVGIPSNLKHTGRGRLPAGKNAEGTPGRAFSHGQNRPEAALRRGLRNTQPFLRVV